jgi:microcystin-dependent protein|tara:strand:- start:827 stop:1474 length:648 start_codon:yes stop_codon:yes gene_type:complete
MANLQDITNRSEVGTIKPWGKATAPAGYLLCDGSAVSRTTYADLFAVISTTYGAGDSSTTFNVPDLQGKFPQGKSGTTNLATTGGANTVTVSVTNNQAATNATNQTVTITGSIDNTSLTTAQLASHGHSMSPSIEMGVCNPSGPGAQLACQVRISNPNRATLSVGNQGSGTAHNHGHTLTGTLTGNITTTLTGAVTASGTNSFSPFVITQYIIKH